MASIGAPPANRAWAIFLGIVFAIIAISLLVASWTKWGQSKALAKCVGIAVLAHIWLLLYAYGTRIVSPGYGPGSDGGISQPSDMPAIVAWEGPNLGSTSNGLVDDLDPSSDPESHGADATSPTPAAQPWEMSDPIPVSEQINAPKLPDILLPANEFEIEQQLVNGVLELPAERSDQELLSMADLPIDPMLPPEPSKVAGPEPSPSATRSVASLASVPELYRMRLSPDRARYAANHGGDASTETAVQNALAWLARAQSPDGSWNAQQYGAGGDAHGAAAAPEGLYRAHAGRHADTAMTGLALLAFLGAGHTHREGPYAETVLRGLRYLIAQQFPSGDLSGRNQVGQDPSVRYARMYSHGMASLAMAEAYAMTNDPELLPTLRASAGYTLKAMNPRTGGWRYDFASDDPGDTSQFGWQAMLLNSASKSGAISIPGVTRLGLQRFLDSVSTGRSGGLAVYRNVAIGAPASAAAATPSMTAEAMAMRCMLDIPLTSSAAAEARGMILSHLPGSSEENLYYWYYAALSMFQLRSMDAGHPGSAQAERAWGVWNEAMKRQLCGTQIVNGPDAGSWNPTCVWGSYGGRVYSTALACMCLEVYYRYLPIYEQSGSNLATSQTMPGENRK